MVGGTTEGSRAKTLKAMAACRPQPNFVALIVAGQRRAMRSKIENLRAKTFSR